MFLKHSIQIAVFSAVAIIAGSLNAQQPRANRDDRLKEILKRYPKADTNGDGVLESGRGGDVQSKTPQAFG